MTKGQIVFLDDLYNSFNKPITNQQYFPFLSKVIFLEFGSSLNSISEDGAAVSEKM